MRRIEFVGLPSPYADPEIKLRRALGTLTAEQKRRIRDLEGQRQRGGFARFPGVSVRILGREAEAMGPGAWREVAPGSERPRFDAGGRFEGLTVADGWSPAGQLRTRVEPEDDDGKTVVVRGKTYVAEPGWDRVYVFGPYDFVQLMTDGDVARLFASEANRRCFRDTEAPLLIFPSGPLARPAR